MHNHRSGFGSSLCLVILTTLAGGALAQEVGPLVGKPLPALELSHTLQGPAWKPSDLRGSVVLLDFFQLG